MTAMPAASLMLDASKPVPAFTGDFRLDGVQARPLLSDAAQFSLLSGRTKLALQLSRRRHDRRRDQVLACKAKAASP